MCCHNYGQPPSLENRLKPFQDTDTSCYIQCLLCGQTCELFNDSRVIFISVSKEFLLSFLVLLHYYMHAKWLVWVPLSCPTRNKTKANHDSPAHFSLCQLMCIILLEVSIASLVSLFWLDRKLTITLHFGYGFLTLFWKLLWLTRCPKEITCY